MFRDEQERQRAREAAAWCACQCPAIQCADRIAAEDRFDRLYPVVEAPASVASDEWLDAVSKCIIAISENLHTVETHRRSTQSEAALAKLTDALVASGKELPDAK